MVKFLQAGSLKILFALFPAFIFCHSENLFASHIVGGELGYTCLGNNNYLVTLKVYRDCYNGQAAYDDPSNVFIYNNNTGALVNTLPIPFPGSNQLSNNTGNPCLIVPPNICVEVAIFTYQVNLPPVSGGYTMIYQRCCRNYTIVNIVNPSNTGATYEATIPDPSLATCNSSPFFVNFPPTLICVNEPFVFDHSAIDPDGDSLVYELCAPYDGANSLNPYPAIPLPYTNVNFLAPYSATDPMGGAPPMSLDPVTGLLTVTPTAVGQYVVGVCCSEYRNGNLLSVHRRDFQFNVTLCSSATASINGGSNSVNDPALFNACDAFTFYFPNNSSNATSYHWDFGVPGITNDTSNAVIPVYTYPDTGTYMVTLTVNPGSTCGDTAYGIVYVYPVLTGGILFPNGCEIDSLQFNDETTVGSGNLNYWFWTFGDGGSSFDQNPVYVYDTIGSFLVNLIVGTDLGCVDTVSQLITIHPKPIANAFADTVICYLDTVQLIGSGIGDYLWLPAYGLNSNTLQTPFASPDISTNYVLTVTNQWGCFDTATVAIGVLDSVQAFAGTDTVICPGGMVQLNATGYIFFDWSPGLGLSATNINNPVAQPGATATYVMTTWIGSCIDSDSIVIGVKQLPEIAAGPDVQICIGDSVMIQACCGTNYLWDPSLSLTDPFSPQPIAFPGVTTTYVLTATDSLSCPLVVKDSLTVFVLNPPPLVITPDTLIYLGTSAQLYAYGADYYQWLPADNLNDAFISNPFATPVETTTYSVDAITSEGCALSGSVKVTVVEDPLVVMPNAFTPNGDGVNDYFRPVIFGMFAPESFQVFNRWGQMLYQTKDVSQGWDGKYQGIEQHLATYVYLLTGKSETTGKAYSLKGNVVLLR